MKKLVSLLALILVLGSCASGPQMAGSSALSSSAAVAAYFADLKRDPVALRNFLTPFPKGADLHSHLSGAVYAESYIAWALKDELCVYVEIHQLNDCPANVPAAYSAYTQRKLSDQLQLSPAYRLRLIDAFSVRNFTQSHGGPSGADQFFASFDKFSAATDANTPAMLAEVLNRAGAQNVSYVEVMMTPEGGSFLGMGSKLDWSADLTAMERALAGPEFEATVRRASDTFTQDMAAARQLLACSSARPQPGCSVELRILAQALRDFDDIRSVFALIMGSFHVAQRNAAVVGVNFVMREDGEFALRDYVAHMRIMRHFTERFPEVPLSLHAGELTLGLVPPGELRDHIALALDAGARRIGHGIDIGFETNAIATLRRMAEQDVLVEINLTSNQSILGVTGDAHPFQLYRANGVPVALSTDDEGVLRIDLTNEYLKATLTYDLDYETLKQLARNALSHSFLPEAGKQRLLQKLEQDFVNFEAAVLSRSQ